MAKLFLHGVPDTPYVWTPLIDALGLGDAEYTSPAMPGFGTDLPAGFTATKDAYLDWLIGELEALHARSGPVDLVGHDWGAILAVRAAHLRPELIASWAVTNAVPWPDYRWHANARRWQTPVVGEIAMWLAQPSVMQRALAQAGMPPEMARHEAQFIRPPMKKAILRLYRSAKIAGQEWGNDLNGLPQRGLVLWGANDPFVELCTAEAFCTKWSVPLHVEEGAGHWALVERANAFALRMKEFWAT